jgi:phosphoribosylanthranilate isomerase
MRIKICGLTNLDDALAAIDAGATHLGFNFYPKSPRCLTPAACAELISSLATRHPPPVTFVGLFVNDSPAVIAAILDDCGLDLAQIHGDDSPEQLQLVRGRFYKAFRGTADGEDFAAYAALSFGAPALLVDAHVPGAYGGTGQLADWEAAQRLAGRYPIFLAGGLTPENVAAAVERVRPWGVDVASGVESSPGKKDHAKMRAFVKAVWKCGDMGATPIPTYSHTAPHPHTRS